MQGMSERQYATHAVLSRGAVQKAKTTGRLVLHADGSIDAEASDARRADTTDPTKTRKPSERKLKPVPEAAVSSVGETLREQGMTAPAAGGGTTFLQARTANEVLKAQERRIRLQKLKGELVDRARAEALTFRLAREERDAWVTDARGRAMVSRSKTDRGQFTAPIFLLVPQVKLRKRLDLARDSASAIRRFFRASDISFHNISTDQPPVSGFRSCARTQWLSLITSGASPSMSVVLSPRLNAI